MPAGSKSGFDRKSLGKPANNYLNKLNIKTAVTDATRQMRDQVIEKHKQMTIEYDAINLKEASMVPLSDVNSYGLNTQANLDVDDDFRFPPGPESTKQ